MPDIEKINNVAVADISKLDSITFADGQKVNNQDVSLVADAHTLISTPLQISDGAQAAVTVTSGIDSTYDVYEFHFINIHPSTTASILAFQVDVSGSTSYNQTITSSAWEAEHGEDGSGAQEQYRSNRDLAQVSDDYQQLSEYIGNTGDDNDLSGSGILTIFEPSSSSFVKHWMSTFSAAGNDVEQVSYHAGHINTTTAIDKIKFVMTPNDPSSVQGTIASGTIKMYGLAKS